MVLFPYIRTDEYSWTDAMRHKRSVGWEWGGWTSDWKLNAELESFIHLERNGKNDNKVKVEYEDMKSLSTKPFLSSGHFGCLLLAIFPFFRGNKQQG